MQFVFHTHYIVSMNTETKNDQLAKWRAENPNYSREWHKKHPDYNREQVKQWRADNIEKARESGRVRQRKFRTTNNGKTIDNVLSKKYRDKRRELLDAIKLASGCKNRECKWMGSYQACCLDFHHIDPESKSFHIGSAGRSLSKVLDEICKCTVLCAMCHRMVTWADLDASTFDMCLREDVEKRWH